MATYRSFLSAKKLMTGLVGVAGVGGATLLVSLERSVAAGGSDPERMAHAPSYPWSHNGLTAALDARSIRRGYEVYKGVCAVCHSCTTVAYRMLANVCMTTEEAKAEAKRAMIKDGPDSTGEMFERPGKLADYLPNPYPNDEAAAYANGGKAPPDLGLLTFGRLGHGGENYIFSLLTGYEDPPAGYQLDEGLYFNPYFLGGAIAMPPPLYNGVIEYSDGTPATKSQCAKDVSVFLRWAAEPWHDERKKLALKIVPLLAIATLVAIYANRVVWTVVKNQKVFYIPKKKAPPS